MKIRVNSGGVVAVWRKSRWKWESDRWEQWCPPGEFWTPEEFTDEEVNGWEEHEFTGSKLDDAT